MAKPKLRCLDDFLHFDGDTWHLADDVADDARELMEDDAERSASHGKTGNQQVFTRIEHLLAQEGVERKASYLRQLWETSDSWPPEERYPTKQADFSCHLHLRALTYPNRRVILGDLIKRHGGRISQRDVIRWRQERGGTRPVRSWADESLAQLNRWVARRIGKDRGRATVSEARHHLIDLLRAVASDLEALD
jgi:hypothetical protein